MKSLKTFMTWLMVLVCLNLTVTSCSDDDDEENDVTTGSIIGTWEFNEDDEYIETMTFSKDGTFKATIKEYNNGEWETDYLSGSYTYKNNTITIENGTASTGYGKVISLTSNSMTLETIDGDRITYKKV